MCKKPGTIHWRYGGCRAGLQTPVAIPSQRGRTRVWGVAPTVVVTPVVCGRWSKDLRAGAPGGKTALLPLSEQPCPSCTSVVDGLNGAAIADRVNLVVVAKTDPARLGIYAQERGWRNLRLLSTRYNTFNRDYHGETPEGEQLPVLNVFSRDEDGIHHRWASELTFVRGDNSPLDPVWPIWGVLDLTPNGRGETAAYPSLQYELKPTLAAPRPSTVRDTAQAYRGTRKAT